MLAALISTAHNPSKWNIRLRFFSQVLIDQRAVSLSFPCHDLDSTCNAEVVTKDMEVFEGKSGDHIAVSRASSTQTSSILTLVENRLPKSLTQPSPSDMIFEDAAEDPYYAASTPVHYSHSPTSLLCSLTSLISSHDFENAFKFLLEMQNSGLAIPFSHVYESAAQATLSDANLKGSERVFRFISWLSLIPPAPQANKHRKFLRTRNLLYHSSLADPYIAAQAALILASKGYALLVSAEAIPFIARFSSPDFSLKFIHDFEQAHEKYLREYHPKCLIQFLQEFKRKVRSAAIKTLVYSGYLEQAITFLQKDAQKTLRLTARACEVLLDALCGTLGSHLQHHIPLVESFRDHAVSSKVEVGDRHVYRWHLCLLTKELDPLSPQYVGDDLALRLRNLTTLLLNKNQLPSISSVGDIIEECLSTDRTKILKTIRRIALDSHPRSASHFLLAEMLFYRSRGFDRRLLSLFAENFYFSGVPVDDILDKISSEPSHCTFTDLYKPNANSCMIRSRSFVPHTPESRRSPYNRMRLGKYSDRYRHKLWPTIAHRNLVWISLVNCAQDDTAIDKLYNKLLVYLSRQEGVPCPSNNRALSKLHRPALETRVVGAEAFTPFITRRLSEFHPMRGACILTDMAQAGITPSIHHFTQMASFYAEMGDARKAFFILDMLEERNPVEERQSIGIELRSCDHAVKMPQPDLVLYTSLMRAFIKKKNFVDAKAVEYRMRKRFTYTHGQHRPLDWALADLMQLQQQSSTVQT